MTLQITGNTNLLPNYKFNVNISGFTITDWLRRILFQNKTQSHIVSICSIVKDETAYLEEWIRYHQKIGVDHFFLYDNASKIPVVETLKKLGLSDCATVIKIHGRARQVKAYNDCLKRQRYSSQWIAFIDADEFIVPKSTNGDLKAFLKKFEQFGGMGINWLIFGSGGHTKKTNRPQVESFLLRSEVDFHLNNHVKMLVQPKYTKRCKGAHFFTFINGYYAVNEKYIPITSHLSDISIDEIQLNHYWCRSLEEHYEKVERGLADTTRRKRTIDEFFERERDANKLEDRAILDVINNLNFKSSFLR